jgi:uncharacterized oxidoreductase
MKLTNNKILITGGASGIGYGLAERFIAEGNTVIICGRRKDVLDEAEKKLPGIITYQCDLSAPEGREGLAKWVSTHHSDVNVLINNAGIQQWMSINDDNYIDRADEEISINIEAPVHLSWLFSKMESINVIMNVSSGLSFSPLVKTPVYSATKAFLHSYTLSLRHMLRSKGIEVIEIIPPALNTDLGGKGIHDFAPPVSDFINAVFEQLKEGKTEVTFGFSDAMLKAGAEDLKAAFEMMNQSEH